MGLLGAASEAFVLQLGIAEIYQQPHFDTRSLQIVDYLSLMFRGDGFRCLEFDDDLVLNQQIREKSSDRLTSECYFYGLLGNGSNPLVFQRDQHCFFVNGLEEPGAQFVTYLKGTPDYGASEAMVPLQHISSAMI